MQKTNVKLTFFSLMFIVAFLLTGNKYTFICILAAFLHELGHVIAARLLDIKISEFSLGVLGARLRLSERVYSYGQEVIVSAAGPFSNIVFALLAFLFFDGENAEIFIAFSLFLAILNLLPIRTFDGGRIFECLLLLFLPLHFSKRIIDVSTFIFIFFLWSVSVYFLLIYASSLNLFIFSASLFSSLLISEENGRFS